ncbi:MAG: hypothetical protein QOC82_694 [Frankiaceae bacterium]|jgi:hypothetical protein|nr:hypothetical protein [Frankiaceae bacterium]
MRRTVVFSVAAALAAAVVPVALASGHDAHPVHGAVYLVGGGVADINPTSDMLANHDFYLGGYGFSDFKVGNQVQLPSTEGRWADGVLGDGAHSRAFGVSDFRHTIVLAQIETQGYFAAYKVGPFGITEIRKDASAEIANLAASHHIHAPVPSASEILVDSDHSHGGADTAGVWGGVPTSYLKLVHDRTVQAIVDAWQSLRPAVLTYGAVHGGVSGEAAYRPTDGDWLIHNQFSNDPNNQVMDDEVRVLQARDPHTGTVLDTYVNFSAHPTVLGSSNTKVTGDYVGRLNDKLEAAFGGFGMDQVGTLGRTQPERTDCPGIGGDDSNPTVALCKLDSYADRVVTKVKEALAVSSPLTGRPQVALNSYLLTDAATNPVLLGSIYAGRAIGAEAGRAANTPWFTGNLMGTTYFSGRIGDVLLSGGPGEMYPQIVQKVRDTVTGMRGYMSLGTAGDFLGYIIAPLEAYPCPATASVLSGACDISSSSDPTQISPDPIGNDNYFFNVSHTFGERLTCDLLRGAGDVVAGDAQKFWSTYNRCAAFANDLALPAGTDTLFPSQPDLSAAQPHM